MKIDQRKWKHISSKKSMSGSPWKYARRCFASFMFPTLNLSIHKRSSILDTSELQPSMPEPKRAVLHVHHDVGLQIGWLGWALLLCFPDRCPQVTGRETWTRWLDRHKSFITYATTQSAWILLNSSVRNPSLDSFTIIGLSKNFLKLQGFQKGCAENGTLGQLHSHEWSHGHRQHFVLQMQRLEKIANRLREARW